MACVCNSLQRAADAWWRLLLHLPSPAAALPLLLLVICSGDVADSKRDCPLMMNGRLAECNALMNKTLRYTDQQLFDSCKMVCQHNGKPFALRHISLAIYIGQSKLQAKPQCLRKIAEECQQMEDVDPLQIDKLHNLTLSWQRKFDDYCATILELHQSTGTASFISTSCPSWSSGIALKGLTAFLVGLWILRH